MRAVIAHDSCMSQFVYVNIPPPQPSQSFGLMIGF